MDAARRPLWLAVLIFSAFFLSVSGLKANQAANDDLVFSPGSPPDIKVYIYSEKDLPDLAKLKPGAGNLRYNADADFGPKLEVILPGIIAKSAFLAQKPSEADFFLLPVYSYGFFQEEGGRKPASEQKFGKLLESIIPQLPYFHMSGGENHLLLWPDGEGPSGFRNWKAFMPNSIFLTTEAAAPATHPADAGAYVAYKDIIVPPAVHPDLASKLDTGAMHAPAVRPTLMTLVTGDSAATNAFKTLTKTTSGLKVLAGTADHDKVANSLASSSFCLIPQTKAGTHLGPFVQSVMAGCVPVLLGSDVRLPFEANINYAKFTVKWPATRLDTSLLEYVKSVPQDEIEAARKAMLKIACAFSYHRVLSVGEDNNIATGCNAVNAIMRELSAKRRNLWHSPQAFWELTDDKLLDERLKPMTAVKDYASEMVYTGTKVEWYHEDVRKLYPELVAYYEKKAAEKAAKKAAEEGTTHH